MPGFAGYMAWIAGALFELLVVILVIRMGKLARFWDLFLYSGFEFVASLSRYLILQKYGLTSPQYMYFYYYSDTLLTVALTLVLLKLFGQVFRVRTWMGIPLRLAVPGLAGVALFSYGVVSQSPARFLTHFVVEFSQNLYFASLILVVLLWVGTIVKNLPPTAEVKLVWLLTIYYGIFISNYYGQDLYPTRYDVLLKLTPPIAGVLMSAGMLFIVCTEDSHLHVERNR